MAGIFSSFRSGASGGSSKSRVERNLALESFKNIANVDLDSSLRETLSSRQPSAGLQSIEKLLRDVDGPLPIAEVADRLRMDTRTAADALSEGGKAGLLRFTRIGDTTSVELAPLD